MTREIIWKGNGYTNSNDRGGIVPVSIVNHISAGTMSSMDSWFRSPGNKVSSAHFGVARDGRIHQYVKIERMAWANGITTDRIPLAKAPIVKDFGINPNLYTVSIEHEGTDGELTEAQFQ
ncbi:N-acetylmuramoyl-L-alanine amidase, partial [Paenibacillus elgii]